MAPRIQRAIASKRVPESFISLFLCDQSHFRQHILYRVLIFIDDAEIKSIFKTIKLFCTESQFMEGAAMAENISTYFQNTRHSPSLFTLVGDKLKMRVREK